MRRIAAAAMALLFALAPLAARAQSSTGAITINVVDTTTGTPLADVRIFLTGAVIASALTTKSGIVKYTDVPVGIYRVRVARRGYEAARSSEFEVLDGKDVTVRFALNEATTAQGGPNENLRVIGSVTVRANVQISTNDLSDESPVRRLSDSMMDALDKLAGVSVTQDSNDPNSAVTISLNGHDESQTAISLDGIPLSAPGVASNLRNAGTDLFRGASTSFGPTAAGLGGSVNFRTLEPTQSWNERLSSTYGTYDRWNYQIAATGSVGKLGLAVMHSSRGGNNPLTFQDYLDTSGLAYPHEGWSSNLGDFLKLRYRLTDTMTLTGSYLVANNSYGVLCTQFVTNYPCGIGPGNTNTARFSFGYGTLSSLIGNVALTLTAFATGGTNVSDELDRYVSGVNLPYYANTQSHTNGYAFTASVGHNRHTFTLQGNTYDSTSVFVPTALSQYVLPSSTSIYARQLQFSDAIKSNEKLTLNLNGSYASTSGIGGSVLGGAGATWRPSGNDTWHGAVSLGSAQPGTTLPRTLSDPASARFNCGAGTTIVSGPGDLPQNQSSVSYNLDWTHQWRTGQFTLNAFRQSQIGQTINALVNGLGEPSGYLPPGYIGQLGLAWSAPTVCGGTPFNPSGIYVNQPISGTARVYSGFDVSARIGIGRNVVLLPTYTLNSAVLVAADSRLMTAQSTTIVGAQLPGRPLNRAGLTIDAFLPRSNFELLANAQYTGSNNNRYLVPFTTVNAGISHPVGQGRVTLFVSNLFNAVSGDFSTLQYAEPVPVSGGGVVFFAANPLTPRQINVNYTVTVGKGAQRVQSPLAQNAQFAARQASGGPEGARGPGGPGGPGGGPGGFLANFRPNVLPPGGDPFALALSNPLCNAEAQEIAKPILERMRAYVTAFEKSPNETPVTAEGYVVTPHLLPAGSKIPYWIEFRPENAGRGPGLGGPPGSSPNVKIEGAPVSTPAPRPSATAQAERQGQNPNAGRFRAILACQYFTPFTQEEANAKGIVTNGRVFLGYAPGIGIFGVQPRQLPQGGGSLRGS
ncbi:MAG: TonB-dependent receptor [Candidatus Eremiobacteraeota bacterium]|nr:TonB-dependent receptor [Candidatus Eremiobacteraeota bacterium]